MLLQHIIQALQSLQASSKEFHEILAIKISYEQKDPFILPKLKTVNTQYLDTFQNEIKGFGTAISGLFFPDFFLRRKFSE